MSLSRKGDFQRFAGLEIKIFSREPNCIFKRHFQVLCIETSTFLGSLQKFEGAAGEFKGALGSRHPLISSPGLGIQIRPRRPAG